MADVQKLSDEELSEAVDRIPLDLVADDPPVVKEWVTRARAQRQLEKIGIRVTREEAIQISRQMLKDAERGRIEMAEQEARQGPTYSDDEPTEPAGIRALSEILKAWQERRRCRGDQANIIDASWTSSLDSVLCDIKITIRSSGQEAKLYGLVANLSATCLAWLQVMAGDE